MQYRLGQCAALFLAASVTSGCVSLQPTMTNFSVDYNRVIADTRNRMILLNIVRSAYREPTYYTAVSQIEGSLNVQAAVSGPIANLAGGDATAFSPTVSGSFTNAPTFTIVPLNSDEFAKGMLQPIDPETIRMFLSQGWRAQFLAPLVVQKVECIYDGEVVADLENEPGSADGQVQARDFAEIAFHTGKAENDSERRLTVASSEAFKQITSGALDKFDFQLSPVAGDQAAVAVAMSATGSPQLEAHVPDAFKNECRARFAARLTKQPGLAQQLVLKPAEVAGFAVREEASAGGSHAPPVPRQISLYVVFRSPDAIVYFLGKRLRAEIESGKRAVDPDGDTLFGVARNASGPAAVAVTHRGQRWSIPAVEIEPNTDADAPVDRSLEVMALLNELISVQTSLKEFSRAPSSIRVR